MRRLEHHNRINRNPRKRSNRRNNHGRHSGKAHSGHRNTTFYPGHQEVPTALPDTIVAGRCRIRRFPAREIHRGDVWFAQLGLHPGTCVEEGCRPVVVLSNEEANMKREVATVVPMTTKHKRYYLPTHVPVTEADLTDRDEGRTFKPCLTMAEQITTISRQAFVSYMGRITDGLKLREIEEAVAGHLEFSTPAPFDPVPITQVPADICDPGYAGYAGYAGCAGSHVSPGSNDAGTDETQER